MVAAKNSQATAFVNGDKQWKKEYAELRKIALDSGLTEEFKWYKPCYSYEGKNVFLIHGFNDYCALLFFKGSLMKDPKKLLVQQTKNVQVGRQLRFSTLKEITAQKSTIAAYIKEAIRVEKSGAKAEMKKTQDFDTPRELEEKFRELPRLKEAFEALTPGRQRAYLLYFGDAKQSSTREARIEKYADRILDGIGLNDFPPKKKK